MREVDGNSLEGREWSGMFLSMSDSSPLTNDEIIGHLKGLVNGKTKRAITELGYSGAMYQQAWNTMQRKLGQPSSIVSTQLAKIQTFHAIKHHDSLGFIEFVDSIAAFVRILQQFGYSNDLFSNSSLDTEVSKLATEIKRGWFAFDESPIRRQKLPNLMELTKWLQQEAQVHVRLVKKSSFSGISGFKDSNSTNRGSNEKRVDGKKSKRPQDSSFNALDVYINFSSKCAIDNDSHRIWNCEHLKQCQPLHVKQW